MTKLFVVLEQSQNLKVAVNPLNFEVIVPGPEGTSEVYVGAAKLVISNDAIQAMIREANIEVLEVQEPQIAGVTDEDIKDESEPVKFEDIVDTNDTEREEDKAAE